MISYVGKEERDGPRGSPEKTQRNAAIARSYLRGETYRQIAVTHGVCHARIGQILKRLGLTGPPPPPTNLTKTEYMREFMRKKRLGLKRKPKETG